MSRFSRMAATLALAAAGLLAHPGASLAEGEDLQWAWMKGSTNDEAWGIYGTPRTPDSANTPGARSQGVSWSDLSGALWIFGGWGRDSAGSEGYLNDLWKFDPATAHWTWIKGSNTIDQPGIYGTQGIPDPANTPGARQFSSAWTDDAGALWLFGGEGFDGLNQWGYLNDLWKFDPATTHWTWIKGTNVINQKGTYSSFLNPASAPGARNMAFAWTDAGGMLWLFGGQGYGSSGFRGYLNDLWKFDPATTNWMWMKGANLTNQPATYGTKGTPDAANTPGARKGRAAWIDNTGALWLFGGYYWFSASANGRLDDLWKFDPVTGNWTWMKGSNTTNQPATYGTRGISDPANNPGARNYPDSWTDLTGTLWLFGGREPTGAGDLNDLWKFDPATTHWTWIKGANTANQYGVYGEQAIPAANNTPGGRAYGFTAVDRAGALWLFGGSGYGANSVGNLNDLWRFPQVYALTYIAGAHGSISGISPQRVARGTSGSSVTAAPVAGRHFDQWSDGSTANPRQDTIVTQDVTVTASFALDELAAPDNVSASDGRYTDKVALSWSDVSNASGYSVWRHTADDSSSASLLGATADTYYSDMSATGGTLYYHWVKATNAFTTSAFSASASGWRRSVGYSHFADVDIDGDRKADLVLFDPATGTWRAKLSASGYAEVSGVFGSENCTLVPGDYDGDRMTDPGVYEEASGLWQVMLSGSGYATASATLGGMGYAPTPGDFDGDRKTDLGVYQALSGKWQVMLSASGYATASLDGFGDAEHLPVQRDYDGDRKYDPAIYNLLNGNWRVMLSGSGYGIATAVGFGGAGYAPVVGEYDADGKADPAIYHESTGLWTVMLSGSGYLIATGTLGGTGYTPLPGNYDGDGRTDPAVYHPATGQWIVMLSGSGYGLATAVFGGESYDPVGLRPE